VQVHQLDFRGFNAHAEFIYITPEELLCGKDLRGAAEMEKGEGSSAQERRLSIAGKRWLSQKQ
jgi:hypothetical protein